ncbi:MAG: peptidase [Flaviaesturariibacter sp.]|nr:peptidase [Flaviaesturariibacter sp.]
MKQCHGIAFLLTLSFFTAHSQPQKDIKPQFAYTEPAIAPDSREIAFVSGGDIWTAGANGGEACLLVSHPATESRPLYSPNVRLLAFQSSRTRVLTLGSGGANKTVNMRPSSLGAEKQALYKQGVAKERAYEDRMSGRLDMYISPICRNNRWTSCTWTSMQKIIRVKAL